MVGVLVYLGVFVLLAIGTLRRPAFGIAAALCMFVIEQWGQTKIPFVASHASLTNYLGGFIVVLGLVSQFLQGQHFRLVQGPVHLCVLLLYAYSAFSLLWTPAPEIAAEEWRHNLPYALLLLVLVPMLVHSVQNAREGLLATRFVGTLLAICFAGFVEYGYRSVTSDVASGEEIRYPGALAQLGGYIFIVSCLLAKRDAFNLALSLCIMVLAGLLVMNSGSRGQLLSMVICTGTFMAMSRSTSAAQLNLWLLFGGSLSILIAYFAFTELSQYFYSTQGGRWTVEGAESAYGGRMEMAGALLDRYLSSGTLTLLFGLGTSASFARDIVGFYPHVVPVEILGELGVVGATIYLVIVWRTLSFILTTFSTHNRDLLDRRIAIVLGALFVFELLLQLKQGSLLRGPNGFLFAILLEVVSRGRKATDAERAEIQPKLPGGAAPQQSVGKDGPVAPPIYARAQWRSEQALPNRADKHDGSWEPGAIRPIDTPPGVRTTGEAEPTDSIDDARAQRKKCQLNVPQR